MVYTGIASKERPFKRLSAKSQNYFLINARVGAG